MCDRRGWRKPEYILNKSIYYSLVNPRSMHWKEYTKTNLKGVYVKIRDKVMESKDDRWKKSNKK